MNRLEIEMFRYGRFVFGKIVHQSDDVYGNDKTSTIISDNGYAIRSEALPELDRKTLCIRGTRKTADENVFHYQYESVESAKNACEAFKSLIYKINNDPDKQPKSSVERVL